MKPSTTEQTPVSKRARDCAAFRSAYQAAIDQLKRIPAVGTPGRAGHRNK